MLFSFECPVCEGRLEADASASGTQAGCPQCGNLVAIPAGRVDVGTTLAGFRLERRLGKGGMGEVYLARQLSVDRQVAVKILPPGFAADQRAVQRFLQEGKLAAKLDHRHIVTVHEAGEDSGNYYLAMAYVEGESLDQRLTRAGALPEAEALTIVRAVADALAYAWGTCRILHRDIKPANIMVDLRGRVFLMDLGLAKSLGDGEGMTLSGSILGTPHYMSPEQAQGRAELGVPSDIYSLGATLYHLVTGTAPFCGDSAVEVLHQHVYDPLPPPSERNPQVSKACGRLIEAMMAKEPADRHGDWQDLLADIDRLLAGAAPQQGRTDKASLAKQAQEALARQHLAKHPAQAGSAAALPSRQRWLPWVLGLAAAGALVLTTMAALAVRGHRAGPAAAGQTAQTAARRATATIPAKAPAAAPEAVPAALTAPAPVPTSVVPPAAEATTVDADPTGSEGATKRVAEVAPTVPAGEPGVAGKPALPPALAALARLILAGRATEACQAWRDNAAELGAAMSDEQRQGAAAQLAALAGMDEQILACFRADIGRTVPVELIGAGTTACEIRDVGAAGVQVMQAIRQGQTTGRVGRILRPADLTVAERLRRLGTEEIPERNLQRAMLAFEAGRPDIARRLFARAESPLGDALATAVEERQAQAREDAAERAVAGLLRQIGVSPRFGKREEVVAEIRRRCGDDLRRVQRARKILADFEREWGASTLGREWVPVVAGALGCPWTGEDWTVPELGMEFVWIRQMGMWVGKYEVTNGEYRVKEPGHDSHEFGQLTLNRDRQPVVRMSWEKARDYAVWLTAREDEAHRLPEGYRYRLPTGDEFVTYAQCGDGREYPWGDSWPPPSMTAGNFAGQESQLPGQIAGYSDAHPVTSLVEESGANPWGIFGIAGNAWECCAADRSPTQSLEGWRGGSWNRLNRNQLRCNASTTDRERIAGNNGLGFRLVLAP